MKTPVEILSDLVAAKRVDDVSMIDACEVALGIAQPFTLSSLPEIRSVEAAIAFVSARKVAEAPKLLALPSISSDQLLAFAVNTSRSFNGIETTFAYVVIDKKLVSVEVPGWDAPNALEALERELAKAISAIRQFRDDAEADAL